VGCRKVFGSVVKWRVKWCCEARMRIPASPEARWLAFALLVAAASGAASAEGVRAGGCAARRPLLGAAFAMPPMPLGRAPAVAPHGVPSAGRPQMKLRGIARSDLSRKAPCSTRQGRHERVAMTSDIAMTGEVEAPARAPKNWALVLWEFSRPHTIVGSVLSVISLHLFAATAPGAAVMNLSALAVALAWAIVCAVLVNIYVTGLNQIFDVDIDKINKPYLPIAAGELSLPAAWIVCVGALVLGIVPSMLFYPFDKTPLLAVTVGSALLGTAYSAPPLRLKRFPLLAALCIIVVRRACRRFARYLQARRRRDAL